MDPRDFLKVANKLHASQEEGDLRTSISRAYYALFLSARDLLEAESLPITRSPQVHQDVPDYLRDSGDQTIEDVGDAIADLRHERNVADYDMHILKFDQRLCALVVAKARAHLQVLDGLNSSARRTIIAAIKAQRGLP